MQYYSIAMVVMFSIMTAFVLVHSIVDERQNNTLFRIKSTPTLNIQYVLGKLTGIIFAILMQMTAVILISWVVFRMNWGNLFDIFVITVVYAFAIGSIVLFWGFTAKDHVAVSSMASPVLYIFSFLGGSFIPKNGLPDSLRVVQEIIPNGKAINSYLKVKQNIGLSGMYIDLLELIGIGLIFVFINIMVFNRKKVA
ncbi:ABC transporter permease [Bacillus velezensis]|nr:ABC transporter permease [Bacillus velezensis]